MGPKLSILWIAWGTCVSVSKVSRDIFALPVEVKSLPFWHCYMVRSFALSRLSGQRIDRPILSKPIMLIRMQITTSDYWIWFIKAFRCKISRSRKSWIIKPMLKCYSFAKQALFQPIYCLGKFQVSIWLEVAFITTSR